MSKPKNIRWIVAYDVADAKRRAKIAAAMEDVGIRIQFSVFECMLTASELKQLIAKLTTLVDHQDDSIRFYPLCADCANKVVRTGKRAGFEDQHNAFIF